MSISHMAIFVYMATQQLLRKGNPKRENESLSITGKNTLMTNYIKPKIDNTPSNKKCRWCSDRDEMVIHIINECS